MILVRKYIEFAYFWPILCQLGAPSWSSAQGVPLVQVSMRGCGVENREKNDFLSFFEMAPKGRGCTEMSRGNDFGAKIRQICTFWVHFVAHLVRRGDPRPRGYPWSESPWVAVAMKIVKNSKFWSFFRNASKGSGMHGNE